MLVAERQMPADNPTLIAIRNGSEACSRICENSKKSRVFADDCNQLSKFSRRIQVGWFDLSEIRID
jgi:hypothetical protein